MYSYTFNKTINPAKLEKEITDAGYSQVYTGMSTVGDDFTVNFENQLQASEETALSNLVVAHDPTVATWQTVKNTLNAVEQFVFGLKREFVEFNMENGITQAGKTREVGLMMREVSYWLDNYSLYEVIAEIDQLIADINNILKPTVNEISPYVTIARLNEMKGKVQTFLGI